jgi:hypothetical protein
MPVLRRLVEPARVKRTSRPPGLRSKAIDATALVTESAKKTLCRNMRDKIFGGTNVADMSALLSLGGDSFIDNGDFASESDESVRHIILPLLSDSAGTQWLVGVAEKLKTWVSASKAETRQFLWEQLSERWKSADEAGKSLLQQLQASWSLPDFITETENEPGQSDGDTSTRAEKPA